MFRVETANERDPALFTYGSREVLVNNNNEADSDSEVYEVEAIDGLQVIPDSVRNKTLDAGFDGHINRNIRLAMTLIDMSKPYIMVDRIFKIKIDGLDQLQIEFKLYGCVNVTNVSYTVNDTETVLFELPSIPAPDVDLSSLRYCNYLIPEN